MLCIIDMTEWSQMHADADFVRSLVLLSLMHIFVFIISHVNHPLFLSPWLVLPYHLINVLFLVCDYHQL